jgi:aldose 1-epimerase
MGIPLLHPWANRLAGFTYGAAPRVVELARDCPLIKLDENGLPIHGVIAGYLPWQALESRPEDAGHSVRAQMRWDTPELLATFPFPHVLELDVVPGDLPNADDGWAVAESAVGAPLVVVAHPVWQRGATGVA